jgi:hypothetical protein
MRAFRIIKKCYFSEPRDILRTEFSAKDSGRWNDDQQQVLYTGDSIETVVAEAGLYWILRETETINRMAKGKPITAWKELADKCAEVSGVIGELEIDPSLNLLLIGDPVAANIQLTAANLSHIHHDAYLKHNYRTFKGFPTRKFGRWLQDQGYDGFQITSARNGNGYCNVIFEPKATQGGVKVVNTLDVKLYGLKQNGKRIDKQFSEYSEDGFEYEIGGKVNLSTPDKR